MQGEGWIGIKAEVPGSSDVFADWKWVEAAEEYVDCVTYKPEPMEVNNRRSENCMIQKGNGTGDWEYQNCDNNTFARLCEFVPGEFYSE